MLAPDDLDLDVPFAAGEEMRTEISTKFTVEQICGEVLASAWMTPFLEPVVRSLELMQRVAPALRPVQRENCGAIPFTVYARNGWPLMAGWRDEAAFLTQTVRFDHYPDDARFARPGDTVH